MNEVGSTSSMSWRVAICSYLVSDVCLRVFPLSLSLFSSSPAYSLPNMRPSTITMSDMPGRKSLITTRFDHRWNWDKTFITAKVYVSSRKFANKISRFIDFGLWICHRTCGGAIEEFGNKRAWSHTVRHYPSSLRAHRLFLCSPVS